MAADPDGGAVMLFTKFTLTPATPATLATLCPVNAEIEPTVATVATVAALSSVKNISVSTQNKGTVQVVPASSVPPADIQATTFEPTGDPVSCLFWLQVCWAVGIYQDQCTRNTDCRVYKFLKLNTK
jgi:hypothetical protein